MIFSAISLFMAWILIVATILANREKRIEKRVVITIQPALHPLPSQQASLPAFLEVPSNN